MNTINEIPPPDDVVRIGVALSGGGFRATAWGIGTMLGVAKASDVRTGGT